MSTPSRAAYLAVAVAVHAGVLWGVHFGPPAFISSEEEPGDAIEVGLIENAEPTPEPPAPEPQPKPEPPPPPPDAIPEPKPAPETPKPEPPKPKAKPAVQPQEKPAAKPSASVSTSPKKSGGSTSGNPNASATGKPGPGDTAHATWRNRVHPSYPGAARAAGQAGRMLIVVNVNALGRATGAQIFKSSGVAALDQAAIAAARASTYNPKRIAGVPLPDTITIPYTFRLEDR